MAILTVGPGAQYSTLSAAVAASQNGDTIEVAAGTYTNDFPQTITDNITIEGVGGMVNLVATVAPPNGKAILDTAGNDTIDNVSFSGVSVADGNGAGIRYESGNLTLNSDYFFNNQEGLLAAASPGGTIIINNSEFNHNGSGTGQTHNLYVNEIATLTINNSLFMDAVVGHEIKSRADTTIIENSRIIDGPTGTASYSVDVPDGGNVVIRNNVIEQGPVSQNPAILHYGGEGGPYANSSLDITGNTVVNDLNSPSALLLFNQTTVAASITNNQIYGLTEARLSPGAADTEAGNTFLTTEPTLDTSPPFAPTTSGTGSTPVIAAPAAETVGQGQATAIAGVSLSETGNTTGETFTATLSNTHGNLSATGTGVSGSGTTALTVTGSLAQVNADLASLQDTDGTVAADTITLNASDSLGNSAAPLTIGVTVNGAPAGTGGTTPTPADYLSELNPAMPHPDASRLTVETATEVGQHLVAHGLHVMLIGTATNEALIGGKQVFDVMVGGPGGEHLAGGYGPTDFLGGPGDNLLTAGIGLNYMQAGAGHDTFAFSYRDAGTSFVYGFNPALDHIDIVTPGTNTQVTAASLVPWATADAAGDAVIHLAYHQVVLEGVAPSHVSAGWFTITH